MIDTETVMAALGGGAANASMQVADMERQGVHALVRELRTEVDRQRSQLNRSPKTSPSRAHGAEAPAL